MAASGFAGVTLQSGRLKPGVDPTAKTVINANGVSLRIYDGATLGQASESKEATPEKIDFLARDIGHVFGLAFDTPTPAEARPPALYAAATSAFGLHITGPDQDGDGNPDRLLKGAPGAKFMDGLFGANGGPGTIWKIDQPTGSFSIFVDVTSNGLKNSGAGLGGLVIDPKTGVLYVSDLDTGLIHRFNTVGGPGDFKPFDHGVVARAKAGRTALKDDGKRLDITAPGFDTADPDTWGMTQRERRAGALALHQGRLYYGIADGPEIWSVALEPGGDFTDDARLETKVKSDTGFPVTSIAFDNQGRMIVAERGTAANPADFSRIVSPGPARVLRFAPEVPDDPGTPGFWQPAAEEYAIGDGPQHRDSDGGLALQHGLSANGAIDPSHCGGTLVASASALGAKREVHGLQLNPVDAIRSGSDLAADHVFINLDPSLDDPDARGYAGGVAVLQDCNGVAGGLPPVADSGGGAAVGGGQTLPSAPDQGAFTFPPVTDDEGTSDAPNEDGQGGKALLTVAKTASVATCSPKGGCAFNVEVRNDTADTIAGPISVNEEIAAPQAVLTGEPNAPWSCTKAAPFICTHPGPVPAGGKLDMRVVFAPNTPPETKAVTNCVSLGVPPAQQAPGGGALPASQCATIPLDPNAPVQTGPIVIAKRAAGPCTAKGPCAFTISVQNQLNSEFPGPIVVHEQVDAAQATLIGEPNAPWTCSKSAPFACTHPGPLPANSTTVLTLAFAANTPPERTELKNCAISRTGVGGKTAPAVPAPGKKAELFDLQRYRALIRPASFRFQSPAPHDHLLHLVGGAGGNIGGATNTCLEWQTKREGFVVQQSNGFQVSFSDLQIENSRIAGGNASYITSSGPKSGKITGGNVFGKATDGSFAGAMAFGVRWNDGTEAVYNLRLNDQGQASGETTDASKNSARLTADAKWFKCARNEVCDKYSKAATETAQKFNKLSCGPDEPPGRWSNDFNSHLQWCMGQPPSSTFLNSETVARTDGLAKCQADRAALCEGYVADALVLAKDFEARKCTEPHSGLLSTDPAAQRTFCVEESRGNLDSAAQSRKILLDACIARLAKDAARAGAADGAQPGNGGGPAQGDVITAEPAPEQCAVVPIDADQQPDGGNNGNPAPGDVVQGQPADQGNGLTIQKQASGTDCSKNKSCDFAITVRAAAAGTPGPITVVDTIDAIATHDLKPGALLSAVPAAPWTCNKEHPIRCTHPGPVPAGGLVLNLGVKPGANATATSMRNCAVIESAPQTAVPPPTGTDTNGTKFEVVPPASCAPGASCAWQLKVTNTSAQSRTGSLIWAAALATTGGNAPVPAAKVTVGQVSSVPPATCIPRENDPARQVDCTLGEVTIAPNASFTATMNLQAETGAATGPLQASMNGSFTTAEGQLTGRATAAASPNAPAVEEIAPEPSCATIPVLPVTAEPAPPVPPEPAADPNGLQLVKRRTVDKCSDLGGGCAFSVTITNSSAAEFNGPIEFTDIFKSADGQPLPNAALEAQPLLTLAEGAAATISCSKSGDAFTCGTGGANARIPAGKAIVANFSIKPGATGGATVVRNCAQLKSGGGDSCSNITLINGPLVRLTKFGGGDTCLPRCTFAVVVQNVGNADASGSFKFKDTFTPPSSLAGYNPAPEGTDCAELNGSLFCTPKLKVLKPGELLTVPITVFGKAKAPQYENCVEFVPQPQAPPAQLVLDNSNGGRCVTVKDTSPQTPNLVIRKRAPNTAENSSDGHCDLKSACRFTIEVTNNGLAPFTGPLRITDTVSLGVPQFLAIGPGSPQSLPWNCSRVQNGVGTPIAQSSITCELPPLPNGLAPGTTATLEVAVTAGATWKGSNRLKNCAEITSDGDIGANAIKQDCAEVVLDPFNVKVAKTGDQSCPPGSNCTFKITLFNPGPIAHNAPVTIADGLQPPVSAQIVSINPPLPCAAQPAAIPFSCTSPGPVRLDLDAPAGSEFGPREFTMVVKMPSDGSVASYRNCISVAGQDGAAGEEACHTVATKPAGEAAQCLGGMVLTNGECSCPPALRWNGHECIGSGGINTTPAPPSAGVTQPKAEAPASAEATCIGGMVLTGGACTCPQFLRWNGKKCVGSGGSNTTAPNEENDDAVVPPSRPVERPTVSCPPNSELRRGECTCRRGFEMVRGRCRPVKLPVPQRPEVQSQCPSDRPVGEFPRCCPQNAQFKGGECRCLPGLQLRSGKCVAAKPAPRPQPEGCPPGQIFINGQCRRLTIPAPQPNPPKRDCGPGYRQLERPNKYGAFCEPIPSQQKCPGGYTGTPPNCQPPKVVYPPCPAGWSGTPGNCKPPAPKPAPAPKPQQPQRCDKGFSGFKPNCTCPANKEVVKGQCIPKIQ